MSNHKIAAQRVAAEPAVISGLLALLQEVT
jgi:hypothetical protein